MKNTKMPPSPSIDPFDYPHPLVYAYGSHYCSVCLHLNFNCTCIVPKNKNNMWFNGKFWIVKRNGQWMVEGPRYTLHNANSYEEALDWLRERIAGLRYRKLRDMQGLP